jgi:hypothetical protein
MVGYGRGAKRKYNKEEMKIEVLSVYLWISAQRRCLRGQACCEDCGEGYLLGCPLWDSLFGWFWNLGRDIVKSLLLR